eukprot:scaffold218524_cov37-Tisochrysis_lutea.AAC.2
MAPGRELNGGADELNTHVQVRPALLTGVVRSRAEQGDCVIWAQTIADGIRKQDGPVARRAYTPAASAA